jgi:hypothetical protein
MHQERVKHHQQQLDDETHVFVYLLGEALLYVPGQRAQRAEDDGILLVVGRKLEGALLEGCQRLLERVIRV